MSADAWPRDADGDVFRRLLEDGFDFSVPHAVDYGVDFSIWPPPQAAIEVLRATYGDVVIHDPDDEAVGYVSFQLHGPVTYAGVTAVQRRTTELVQRYGGYCESWGVWGE